MKRLMVILLILYSLSIYPSDIFTKKYSNELSESFKILGFENPTDFNKDLSKGKLTFPVVKDFLNFPAAEAKRINRLKSNIVAIRLKSYFDDTGDLPKVKKRAISDDRRVDKLISYLLSIDKFYRRLKENLDVETLEKLSNYNEKQEDTLFYERIYEEIPLKKLSKYLEKCVKLMEDINWNELPSKDVKEIYFCGEYESGDYLLIVDRSEREIEFSRNFFKARMFVKCSPCNIISGEVASSACGFSIFCNRSKSNDLS